MWVGFKSRFEGVKSICDTFFYKIIPVYDRLKHHDGKHMFISDATATFTTIPMLDTVKVERAVDTISTFTPYATARYDSKDSAYMDVSYFEPGDSLPDEVAQGVRYLLFSSRRCWPVDFLPLYDDSTK